MTLNADQQRTLQEAIRLHQRMELDAAVPLYEQLLVSAPRHADVLQLLGVLNVQRGDLNKAVDLMERSLAEDPQQARVWVNLSGALAGLGRHEEALESCRRAIALDPANADVHYNQGTLLHALRNDEGALESFQTAITLRPGFASAFVNRGNVLKDLRRYDAALEDYDRALHLDANLATAHNNRGIVLAELGRFEDAVESYRRATARKPDFADAWNNLGSLLRSLRRYEAARDACSQALRHAPNTPFLHGFHVHAKQYLCDWSNLPAENEALLAAVNAGKPCAAPFTLFATPATPAHLRLAATAYGQTLFPRTSPSPRAARGHDKIRIGYFSADFHSHATAYLMAGLVEEHDRARFEIVGFSWGALEQSEMRTRIEGAFDRLHDVQALSDRDTAALAQAQEIDIAVDLKGFTHSARTAIFACGAAPVQVSYLGFPGTMGVDYIDYLISDPVLIPADQRAHYSEKIVFLPETYQANDAKRRPAMQRFSRAEMGLPEKGFVFCSFNNAFKITPEIFDVWTDLLAQVDGSVLWLLDTNAVARENLKQACVAGGVAAARLVFAPRTNVADHLDRHCHADLFLDPYACNGHTTTSDALWAGVPVLTCPRETFAARVSASLLMAVGLPELVTPDLQSYAATARELARDSARLSALKNKLAAPRGMYPLFNTQRLARHLEDGFAQVWDRQQRGLPPADIIVAARS